MPRQKKPEEPVKGRLGRLRSTEEDVKGHSLHEPVKGRLTRQKGKSEEDDVKGHSFKDIEQSVRVVRGGDKTRL